MNNTRRAKIRKVVRELKSIRESYRLDIIRDEKFEEALEKCSMDIEEILYEEQFAYDNIPESLQYSERACQMEENIDALDNCLESIDEIIEEYDQEGRQGEFEGDYQDLIDSLEELAIV